MDFIVKNYILIIIIAAFLIFALIGYLVDSAKNKGKKEEGLLTKPNDEIDVNLIREDGLTEDVTSAPVEVTPVEEAPNDDLANINKDV